MINWGIIKHPINWITVSLMVLFAVIAFRYIAQYAQQPLGTNPAGQLVKNL